MIYNLLIIFIVGIPIMYFKENTNDYKKRH